MSTAPAKPWISPEEYLQRESVSQQRHEYFRGEVFAMPGGSRNHYQITSNLHGELYIRLRGKICRPCIPDMTLKVQATGLYTYPDSMVVCDPAQFEHGPIDALLNPKIIFEVLSPSTEQYDRGTKLKHYMQIPSVTEILLVSQTEPAIEHYIRQKNDQWLVSHYSGLDAVLTLPSISCELPFALIYANVEWPSGDEVSSLR